MQYFDPEKNKIFIGNINKLNEWLADDKQEKVIEKTKLLIKNYLELDNVSFLFGSGSSIHLGAVAIRNFPNEIEEYIRNKNADIHKQLIKTINELQYSQVEEIKKIKIDESDKAKRSLASFDEWAALDEENIIRIRASNDIAIEFEKVLNYLIAKNYVLEANQSEKRNDRIDELITAAKEGLFEAVDVARRETPQWLINQKQGSKFENQIAQATLLASDNKYIFHEKFLKALLQRPLNLRRANIFTANYDLAFEYAFDKLGIHYIDGFAGFHNRCFKPETFDFDIFYPGSTTAGKIQRIEKVVKYLKLHGSISWVFSESRDANNLYGIQELPLPLIAESKRKGEIIVYPTAVKKTYTLDLPYSELFRQFASTISQPQSVLFTVGYAFADEHFNDIIFQALSNPSFTLIIVDFNGTKNNPNIERIKNLDDSRVIILQGDYFGDFLTFSNTLIPDFYDINSNVKIAKTLNQYFNREDQKEVDGHE
ncbi:MAG: hypothetical protein JWQ25_1022 [Daejeonella sp.]|nr:hypothetical protein [Daejeonella sp.]